MKPEQTAVSVVLLGRFRPADFEIRHLSRLKVLPKPDLDACQYEALLPGQLVSLAMGWGKLTVEPEKLQLNIAQVPYIRGCDLILKLMNEVSPTSTVQKFGINLHSHFRFSSIADRDKLATRLVPPMGWGMLGKRVEDSFKLAGSRHGGLMTVTMREANLSDRSAGWIDVNIQPSPEIADNVGVALAVNDHYEVSAEEFERLGQKPRAVSEHLLSHLSKCFDDSVQRSMEIAIDVLEG